MSNENTFIAERQRLGDKKIVPTEVDIQNFMGDIGWQQLMDFEETLRGRYNLNREIKFPFGKNYGWGFRYTHGKTLLLYTFFEEGGFCATITINNKGATVVEGFLPEMSQEMQQMWHDRYPCDVAGCWIHHSIKPDSKLDEFVRFVEAKIKPKK